MAISGYDPYFEDIYGYFWLHIWAGCGSEPVRRRCPETPPKVRAIHGTTVHLVGGLNNLELTKALKSKKSPPLIKHIYIWIIYGIYQSDWKKEIKNGFGVSFTSLERLQL